MREALREDTSPRLTHERTCFAPLLDAWAREFEVLSMLEGPVDGILGPAGVHGVTLARRGVKVVAAVPSEAHAANVREIYAREATSCDVLVAGETDIATLPRSDMVVSYEALDLVRDWRAYLAELSGLARSVLVVVVRNPEHWNVKAMNALSRFRGLDSGRRGPEESRRTEVLAPELWRVGRVRTHEYFAGEEKVDQVASVLATHPLLTGVLPKVRKRTASLHAFVVDMRPRTPRERRRLALR